MIRLSHRKGNLWGLHVASLLFSDFIGSFLQKVLRVDLKIVLVSYRVATDIEAGHVCSVEFDMNFWFPASLFALLLFQEVYLIFKLEFPLCCLLL